MKKLLISILLLLSATANGETFQGIAPLQTLGDIKQIFPNAHFEQVKAAWVTETDGFYKLSGPGFPGTLYLAFSDSRPLYRKILQNSKDALQRAEAEGNSDEVKKHTDTINFWQSLAIKSDNDALSISWMRWVPENSIPIARYFAKYGKAEKSGFDDSDMRPYRQWTKRGIRATLSDDEKFVTSQEISFTKEEKLLACKKKYEQRFWKVMCNF